MSAPYIGRFAPSPTGPLHFGSLIAAVGSYMEAKQHGGEWLVRMEDVDVPRTAPGAAETILRQLEAFGLAWDGPIMWQSQRIEHYRDALAKLLQAGLAYPCACSRKEIADSGLAHDGSRRYPGTCRSGLPPGRGARAWRLRTDDRPIAWQDALQGAQCEFVAKDVGDFVLLRADGQFAYQLAAVVDDAAQHVTHVVRGADLLDSTGRQILLQQLLAYSTPAYMHLPVATNAVGEKLSKQTKAMALDTAHASEVLCAALRFLGQPVQPGLERASVAEIRGWAHHHWRRDLIPRQRSIALPQAHNRRGSSAADTGRP